MIQLQLKSFSRGQKGEKFGGIILTMYSDVPSYQMFLVAYLWKKRTDNTTQSLTVFTQASTFWPCALSVQLGPERADHLRCEQGRLRGVHLHGPQQDRREHRHHWAARLRWVPPVCCTFTANQSTCWGYSHERGEYSRVTCTLHVIYKYNNSKTSGKIIFCHFANAPKITNETYKFGTVNNSSNAITVSLVHSTKKLKKGVR